MDKWATYYLLKYFAPWCWLVEPLYYTHYTRVGVATEATRRLVENFGRVENRPQDAEFEERSIGPLQRNENYRIL
jgi:hypothetical protein